MRAESHVAVVHGKVNDAASEREEWFARVTIAAILLDGIFDGLLTEAVLELEGRDGQAVDEQAEVECAPRLVAAVGELPHHAEAVAGVQLGSFRVAG